MRNKNYYSTQDPSLVFVPKKPLHVEDVLIREVPSTFNPSEKTKEFIKSWEAKGEYNGEKWQFERIIPFEGGKVMIEVSPIMFGDYFALKSANLKSEEYARPFTVSTIPVTLPENSSRKILLARRDNGSVEKPGTIAFAGSGFHDRYVDPKTGKNILVHPFYTSQKELLEEALFLAPNIFSGENGFMGLGWGSGNVTAFFYQFLDIKPNQVINNPTNLAFNGEPEHDGIYSLKLTKKSLEAVLDSGLVR